MLLIRVMICSYRLPALFREPPSDPAKPYTPYVSPTTAHLIKEYTIPTIRATLEELVVLGMERIISTLTLKPKRGQHELLDIQTQSTAFLPCYLTT